MSLTICLSGDTIAAPQIAGHLGVYLKAFTTITHWSEDAWVGDADHGYRNAKRSGFLPFLELPRRTSPPLELAVHLGASEAAAAEAMLDRHGWRVRCAISRRENRPWCSTPVPVASCRTPRDSSASAASTMRRAASRRWRRTTSGNAGSRERLPKRTSTAGR